MVLTYRDQLILHDGCRLSQKEEGWVEVPFDMMVDHLPLPRRSGQFTQAAMFQGGERVSKTCCVEFDSLAVCSVCGSVNRETIEPTVKSQLKCTVSASTSRKNPFIESTVVGCRKVKITTAGK